jgi:hypothetical protein
VNRSFVRRRVIRRERRQVGDDSNDHQGLHVNLSRTHARV